MARLNKRNAVLEFLKTGKTLTSIEAIDMWKNTRLAADIEVLRKRGYNITTTLLDSDGG